MSPALGYPSLKSSWSTSGPLDQKLKSPPILTHKLTAGTHGCAKRHKERLPYPSNQNPNREPFREGQLSTAVTYSKHM